MRIICLDSILSKCFSYLLPTPEYSLIPFLIALIGNPSSSPTLIDAEAFKTLCLPGKLIINLCNFLFLLSKISKCCFPFFELIFLIL